MVFGLAVNEAVGAGGGGGGAGGGGAVFFLPQALTARIMASARTTFIHCFLVSCFNLFSSARTLASIPAGPKCASSVAPGLSYPFLADAQSLLEAPVRLGILSSGGQLV